MNRENREAVPHSIEKGLQILAAWRTTTLLFGLGFSIGMAGMFSAREAFSFFIGSLLSIINLELTVWIWRDPFLESTGEIRQARRPSAVKLAIKYPILMSAVILIAALELFDPVFFVAGTTTILPSAFLLPVLNRKYSKITKN